jgi:DNA polymerase III subunit epsilon
MRQVVLDTETTGLDVTQGHRIIEIGCVELVNRRRSGRRFHHYLRPDRDIDPGATEVHGITTAMLADKPPFTAVADEFVSFIADAELVIHNAEFDVGFLDRELEAAGRTGGVRGFCTVIDTLPLARRLHPGQRNSLDALCKRYTVDNSGRDLHGALLDAELLADVYLAMTGGQGALLLDMAAAAVTGAAAATPATVVRPPGLRLTVREPSPAEQAAHERYLELLDRESRGQTVWRRLGAEPAAGT